MEIFETVFKIEDNSYKNEGYQKDIYFKNGNYISLENNNGIELYLFDCNHLIINDLFLTKDDCINGHYEFKVGENESYNLYII